VTEQGLRAAFLEHLPDTCTLDPAGAELEAELHARLEAGRAAWPAVALAPAAFVRHLAERTVGAALPGLDRAADLYIACACTEGAPLAVDAFHKAFRGDIAGAVARVDASPAFIDDAVQAVSERLFVRADRARPRIADYAGRASLRGWLSAVAKRTALNLRRNKDDQGHEPVSSTASALGASAGPEIALLKARYKVEFEAAIRASMASLPPRDRTLLLLHLVDGLTLPQIAAMQNVSRATVTRWLAAARDALHDGTRRDLVGRLRLSPSEFESIAALVRSQVDVSLPGAVRGDGTAE